MALYDRRSWQFVALIAVFSSIGRAESASAQTSNPTPESGRSLADLLVTPEDEEFLTRPTTPDEPRKLPDPPQVPDEKLKDWGIRKLTGRHLTLYTDLPSSAEVNELPMVFDAAVAQWASYFRVPTDKTELWQVSAYLMRSKEVFRSVGFYPDDLPPFLHGFQRGREMWLYDQKGDYYRRHLLLHEGTHAFMNGILGGSGPPWYMEGVAELFATHRWSQGGLTMRYTPAHKTEVPYWGRIKVVKEDFQADKGLLLGDVFRFASNDFLEVRAYAWSWAAAAFLNGHPLYTGTFRNLAKGPLDPSPALTEHFQLQIADQMREIEEQWQLFIVNIDYGYDFAANAVEYSLGTPMQGNSATFQAAANRGWQSTGIQVEAGKSYRVQASGRFQVATDPETWDCEPAGITLQYHQGMPLGVLLGAVRPDKPRPGITPLANPTVLGRVRIVKPAETGTLYVKVNDSPARLADNQGQVAIQVQSQDIAVEEVK